MIPKFRFWHREKGCFVDDSLYLDSLGNVYRDVTVDFFEPKAIENPIRPIKNIEVMQSTGLFDNSEPPKEIFEGDIAKVHYFVTKFHDHGGAYEDEDEIIGVIRYGYPAGEIELVGKIYTPRWYVETKNNVIAIELIEGLHEESFTVLGNIHQHPHLLEELE
ncbi:TPA: hypothetical protein U1C38_000392 [Streptococcus suis]|nr:hypothetical protein [Streptococcus suis]